MRRAHRIMLLAAFVAVTPVLAGCGSFDSEKFDLFSLNDKKPLKGERKELFPEGVPGVTQGIPQEYLNKPQKSAAVQNAPVSLTTTNAAPNDRAATPAQPNRTAAVEPAPEPKPKAKSKRKPIPYVAAHPTKPVTANPATPAKASAQPKPAPWPDQKPAQAPWPAQQGQGQAQGQGQGQGQSTSLEPWPSAPPPGTFSR